MPVDGGASSCYPPSMKDQKINASDQPYLITKKVTVKRINSYNPAYGDERLCQCGHPYYRHFDTWENMANVGCKYCDCYRFKEAKSALTCDSSGD